MDLATNQFSSPGYLTFALLFKVWLSFSEKKLLQLNLCITTEKLCETSFYKFQTKDAKQKVKLCISLSSSL